ncbi:MAG: aminoacyl-tRNA hydrolase [Coriobacteriales bacterium]|jgi:PTH1 family peptidyl-tRNA hydrolase
MSQIVLVAGLGNPGEEYAMTRHNSGFMVVDELSHELGVNYWKNQDGCLVGTGKLDGDQILLVKPQAFMNRSGGPLSHVMNRYGVGPDQILVVHDDLDLPAGTIRLKHKGGHGGHNGLRSISSQIGSDYARLRIGIGRPPGRMDPADYVLAKITKKEADDFLATVVRGAEIALYALREGVDAAMLKYHTDS